jgi:N-acetylmuramoyl-L-alanine amidase
MLTRMPAAKRTAVVMAASVSAIALAAIVASPQIPLEPAPPPPPPMPTVVIDPGHGGDDRGAVGGAGIEEKHVVLGVAQRVRAVGAERGLRVLLTREDDRQVSLTQRATIANAAGAALFISLHANASPSPLTAGIEVASLAVPPDAQSPPAPADASRPAPVEERSLTVPLVAGGTRRLTLVPWETAQIPHAPVAAAFAQQLGERLQRLAPLGPRGVYQSPLRPLTSVNVPAVLVDLGYVSNPEEEKLASGDQRQAAVAQALVEAILAFDSSARRSPR